MPKNPYDIKMSDLTADEIAGGESEAQAGKALKETEPKAAAPKPKSPDRPYKKVSPDRPYRKMAKGGKVRGDGCCTKGHTKGKMV